MTPSGTNQRRGRHLPRSWNERAVGSMTASREMEFALIWRIGGASKVTLYRGFYFSMIPFLCSFLFYSHSSINQKIFSSPEEEKNDRINGKQNKYKLKGIR